MAGGPGKYDDEATLVRNRTDAQAVGLIVIGGVKGSGFSVQLAVSDDKTGKATMAIIAGALEQAARDIRADAAKWEKTTSKSALAGIAESLQGKRPGSA